ncbi:MAG: protein translocase subunit SecF, partial [Spirochaetia bacterium]|nr:protein translocase subunit SecF [Spirochaetia bacterium]
LKKLVMDGFADRGPEFEQSRVVSGVISSENQKGAAKVVIWALLGIGLYIAFRFKTYFSIGAIVAVVHDVIVMLGFVVFFQRELSILTVTAVLTVLGYSVNESIVLFDRIREHLKAKRVESFKELLVRSVNDVFTRTLIMISCTLSVVIALYFNSMGSLQDFALVLMVGIISGTYSCIYVSAACLLLIHRYRPQN